MESVDQTTYTVSKHSPPFYILLKTPLLKMQSCKIHNHKEACVSSPQVFVVSVTGISLLTAVSFVECGPDQVGFLFLSLI